MKKALVSVIMATFNDATFLESALHSVLLQTYKNIEFIIINDASTDNTSTILKKAVLKDKRITVINNKKTQGLTKSLNKGISMASGQYIARIDSDDIWISDKKIEKQIDFLDSHPHYGVVGCWSKTIDSTGKIISLLQYPVLDLQIRKYFLIENCFIHSSVLMRASLLKKESAYNKAYQFAQDYDLWLTMGHQTKLHNLPVYMVHYRKNPKGMSQQYYKKQIAETISIIRSHADQYPYAAFSLILWHIRLYIPRSIRESISFLLRKRLFHPTLT